MLSNSRRQFIRTSTFAGLGSVPIIANTKSSAKVIGANDRMRIAVAGLNGRGKSHIGGFLSQKNVEIPYVIDPDKQVLSRTVEKLKDKGIELKNFENVWTMELL